MTFDFGELFPAPPGKSDPVFVSQASDTGDDCHGNLHHISEKRLKRDLRAAGMIAQMRLCVDGRVEAFSIERAIELRAAGFPDLSNDSDE